MVRKIVTLGGAGSYSDLATRKILEGCCKEDFEVCYVNSLEKVIPSIRNDDVFGVVFPIQNKLLGDIGLNYLDGLVVEVLNSNRKLQIAGSINISINFVLCGNKFARKVFVHPVARSQCSIFLSELGLEVVEVGSNSEAVILAKEEGELAIGDFDFALKMGLEIVSKDVANVLGLQTRFLFFGEDFSSKYLDSDFFVYFVELENKPGELNRLISKISLKGINIEELVVRRWDCSNPALKVGNALLVVDSSIDFLSSDLDCGFVISKIGKFGLDWD